jgi:hypothetical protein
MEAARREAIMKRRRESGFGCGRLSDQGHLAARALLFT